MDAKWIRTASAAVLGGAAMTLTGAAYADQVFLDDVIVDGSLCVGQDCANGESFGFDTLRLKENNLRIHFQDTSNTASFPTTDWRIIINSSDNGGGSFFAVQDSDAGRNIFHIEASAPTNSLYVDDGGRIGLGTSTPVVQLHVLDGNTPTLRLDQDGSSGFTPQIWDVAGNEANFFIRDATNGSRLPFKIKPGAPSDALVIAANGNIGVGTDSPLGNMHMRSDGSARQMMVMEQTTAGTAWLIQNFETGAGEGAGNFGVNLSGGGNKFRIDQSGNVYFPDLSDCTNGIRSDSNGMLSCIP